VCASTKSRRRLNSRPRSNAVSAPQAPFSARPAAKTAASTSSRVARPMAPIVNPLEGFSIGRVLPSLLGSHSPPIHNLDVSNGVCMVVSQ
jgi:hypothetical protein